MNLANIWKFIIKDNRENHFLRNKDIKLENKINEYLDWYQENFYCSKIVRNFIEKMAVWYEFKYPDNYLDGKVTNIISSNWSINDFKSLLSERERFLLNGIKYKSEVIISYNPLRKIILDKDGIIYDVVGIDDSLGINLIGNSVKNIEDFVNNTWGEESSKRIKRYNIECDSYYGLLNAILYRIMERGGHLYGPRRAMLFAQEFNCSKDIPMAYGAYTFSLREFIYEYLENGGTKDLPCYLFEIGSDNDKVLIKTVDELFEETTLNKQYTDEEQDLHQRLLNALNQSIILQRKK